MEDKYKHIAELIELFFEGGTSNSQEKELYAFFRHTENLPEHLAPYKRMFRYFEDGIIPKQEKTEYTNDISRRGVKMTFRKKAIAAAAAVFVLLAAVPLYFKYQEAPDPYKGSYIRVRGVKTYDPAAARAEWENIHREMARKEKELEEITRLPDKKTAAYSTEPLTESEMIIYETREKYGQYRPLP